MFVKKLIGSISCIHDLSVIYQKRIIQNSFFSLASYIVKNNLKFEQKVLKLSPSSALLNLKSNIQTTSEDEEKMMKLKKWIEMLRYEGFFMPEHLNDDVLNELIKLETGSAQKKYLIFLAKTALYIEKDKKKKEELQERKRLDNLKRREIEGHITYGLWRNSMFAKVTNAALVNLFHHRVASGFIHNPSIVLDLGFPPDYSSREISSTAKQISRMLSLNRIHPNPMGLHLCNVDLESVMFKNIKKTIPNIEDPCNPVVVSSKSYLDLFPAEKLVYLSPDAKTEMTNFDPDAIYIIGCIVDLAPRGPLTFSKARREEIKMQKLPLDRYRRFRSHKNLAMHVVLKILLDLYETDDWNAAFECIPIRKVFKDKNRISNKSFWDKKMYHKI